MTQTVLLQLLRQRHLETAAKLIYDEAFERLDGEKPRWVPRGNSVRQEDARRLAYRIILMLVADDPHD